MSVSFDSCLWQKQRAQKQCSMESLGENSCICLSSFFVSKDRVAGEVQPQVELGLAMGEPFVTQKGCISKSEVLCGSLDPSGFRYWPETLSMESATPKSSLSRCAPHLLSL